MVSKLKEMINLNELEKKFDKLFEEETPETFEKWLDKQRNMIKHQIISTEKARLLVVDLPEDAKKPIANFPFKHTLRFYHKGIDVMEPIPSGKWQLLGPLSEITEEQVERVVNKVLFDNACDSLHSLVEANVKLRNKYGVEPKFENFNSGDKEDDVDDFDYEHIRWVQEEQSVYHNPILFFEPK